MRTGGMAPVKASLTLALLLSSPALAQIKVGVSSGINFPSASIPFGTTREYVALHEYWRPGTNIVIAIQFAMVPWMEVGSVLEYNRYPFHGYSQATHSESPQVKGSSGEASQILRTSLETMFIEQPDSFFSPYVVTGLTQVVEEIGHIRVTWARQNGPDYTTEISFDKREYWAHTVGLGCRLAFWRDVSLDVSARYFSNYHDRLDASVNIGMVILVQN